MWSFRGANEKNKLLLINYKKSLQYSNINKDTIKAYQKDVYGLMLWLQDKDIDTLEATVDDLSEYMNSLDISKGRRERILVSLNRFYELNKKNKKIKNNIIKEYGGIREAEQIFDKSIDEIIS